MTLRLAVALLAALAACSDARGVRCDPLAPGEVSLMTNVTVTFAIGE